MAEVGALARTLAACEPSLSVQQRPSLAAALCHQQPYLPGSLYTMHVGLMVAGQLHVMGRAAGMGVSAWTRVTAPSGHGASSSARLLQCFCWCFAMLAAHSTVKCAWWWPLGSCACRQQVRQGGRVSVGRLAGGSERRRRGRAAGLKQAAACLGGVPPATQQQQQQQQCITVWEGRQQWWWVRAVVREGGGWQRDPAGWCARCSSSLPCPCQH